MKFTTRFVRFRVCFYALALLSLISDAKVEHLEPWEKNSRKLAGQVGMCAGVSTVLGSGWPASFVLFLGAKISKDRLACSTDTCRYSVGGSGTSVVYTSFSIGFSVFSEQAVQALAVPIENC